MAWGVVVAGAMVVVCVVVIASGMVLAVWVVMVWGVVIADATAVTGWVIVASFIYGGAGMGSGFSRSDCFSYGAGSMGSDGFLRCSGCWCNGSGGMENGVDFCLESPTLPFL